MITKLEQAQLFKDVDTQVLEEISTFCTPLSLEPGDTFIAENDPRSRDLFILCSGRVEIITPCIAQEGTIAVEAQRRVELEDRGRMQDHWLRRGVERRVDHSNSEDIPSDRLACGNGHLVEPAAHRRHLANGRDAIAGLIVVDTHPRSTVFDRATIEVRETNRQTCRRLTVSGKARGRVGHRNLT